jgi:putative ABC transport system permease protein
MLWRNRSQKDFSSEIQSHINLETDRLRAAGLSEEEARSQAQKAFGNLLRSEEKFYESQRVRWLDHLQKDLIYATRQLAKNKTFTVVAVLTLALGVGSTTGIFTLVHATLLRALPFREGNRIVHISDVRTVGQSTGGLVGVPRFFDLQARSKSFDSLAFFYFDHPTLIAGSLLPTPLAGAVVSGRYWNTIGIQPMLGRAFTEIDDRANSPQVAIISYPVWQRLFGGDPGVVNRQVTLDGRPATIAGVLPSGLEYPRKVEIWTPSHFDPTEWTWRGEGTRFVNVYGRLKRNILLSSFQQELWSISERLRREHPDTDANWRFGSESLRDSLYGGVRSALIVLMAAAGVLLLIACINVANLLLSRGTTRAQEIALRRALGASQRRIVAQFLTENTVLALLGAGLGLLGTYVAIRWFGTNLPGRLGGSGIEINWPIVLFTLATAVLTAIVFGCVPALQARRLDLNTNLKRGDARVGSAAGSGIRTAFISTEVALSLVLLVGASLLAESLWHLINSPLGFEPDHVLTFQIVLPRNEKASLVKRFFDGLQSRISLLPGVIAVGQISALPTEDWHLRSNFDVDWKSRTPHGDAVNVEDRAITGEYLRAMGIPLLAGRSLTEADAQAKQPRALVNQQFVRRYFPNGNVIGRHLINKMTQFEIVGIIGNVRGTAGSIAASAGPELYFLPDDEDGRRSFVVRSSVRPETLVKAIREQVHQLDPTQAIRNVVTLTERLYESVAQPRFNVGLLTAFAVIALILACVGIYGVVSYSVTQRSVEIGIRMALGASGKQILSLFVSRALYAALVGLGTGAIAAYFLTWLLRSQLYGVPPDDLLTFAAAALALLVPALLASVLPAARAATLNPVSSLRKD